VQLEQVGFRYRRRAPWVLAEVTVSVPSGRIIEVSGHNGAGKSTLLRLLAGVVRPVRGRLTGLPARIGYAPERFPAAQPFTARAYLTHMAAIRSVSATAIESWAERLSFAALLDTRLDELSKGTAHKVGLTQALIAEPSLLILDEPFAGLDKETRSVLPSLLRELTRAGTTVVVSDHQGDLRELPDVMRWQVADHTVRDGEIRTDLTVLEVIVPVDEAAEIAAKLRSDGYEVR
jgi:ABC-type multidrug transport system ATPase subunit